MLKKVTIYGERCSGTNYLEELLTSNFDVEIVWDYGWKHFFGFNDLTNSDDVLFIGIIRNINDWINSFYKNPHHLPHHLLVNEETFLNEEIYSIDYSNYEIMNDRNMESNQKEKYKNIFELRHIKNKFLYETMHKKVKNYLLITYDNLIENFVDVMNQIKNCNLQVKCNIEFPINVKYYKKHKEQEYIKKEENKPIISHEKIIKKANLYYEKQLFPKSII
jgi:hypothetical protein